MLIGFKVKNFTSFNELQQFSMIAGQTRNFKEHITEINNQKILKFSVIYGANASGKSNLIKALNIGKKIVLFGINEIYSNQYFKLNEENKNIPSYFEYEIEKNGKFYSYGFEINISQKTIISEWLIDMTNKPYILFERDTKTIKTDITKKDATFSKFEACKNDLTTNNNVFFLSEFIRRIRMSADEIDKFEDFMNCYDFFEKELDVISPVQGERIKFDYVSKHQNDVKPLLKSMGLDIENIVECETNMLELQDKLLPNDYDSLKKIIDKMSQIDKFKPEKGAIKIRIQDCIYLIRLYDVPKVYAIKTKHATNPNVNFDTYEESDGTLRIIELIDILLSENKTFIIDEIDRSLHPMLTIEFVKLFLKHLDEKKVQLIITTHESRLLDFAILRRDEIWFTDKQNGETKLYSLEQFKDDARFDRKIDKAYLDGRYGAIPIFKNMEDL